MRLLITVPRFTVVDTARKFGTTDAHTTHTLLFTSVALVTLITVGMTYDTVPVYCARTTLPTFPVDPVDLPPGHDSFITLHGCSWFTVLFTLPVTATVTLHIVVYGSATSHTVYVPTGPALLPGSVIGRLLLLNDPSIVDIDLTLTDRPRARITAIARLPG